MIDKDKTILKLNNKIVMMSYEMKDLEKDNADLLIYIDKIYDIIKHLV